ncbi:MAG: [FeFe] hydrogenase H-cluster maturation GTPase HydF [Eggerthellaceae bacterium]|nr:[FeFe] hydrogenase H-cluster maturation GTPase HydF [Eggerthellaceae bacterium]
MAGLNDVPSGERVHIGFFGVRNAGKSSVVNAVTGQDLAVVSSTLGTTTDPVKKAMELLPLGPVVIIDTPGIDDEGDLGQLRVKRAKQALRQCDIAVLVVDATRGLQPADDDLIATFQKRNVPYVIAWNKADLLSENVTGVGGALHTDDTSQSAQIHVSALTGENIYELKDLIGAFAAQSGPKKRLVADLLDEGDVAVLVVPIDSSAPKGRLILPQQMVIRDILDSHATCMVCQVEELAQTLDALREPPKIVITDSQAFEEVAAIVPESVWLTSFSILMARYKGSLVPFVNGAAKLAHLTDEGHVLISEGCSHHRQCEDIGTYKIPKWIREYAGASPQYSFTSGGEFPDALDDIDLVIHCGGCMLNDKEMAHRVATATTSGTPIVNYGIAIAQMHGILARAIEPFDLLG